MLPFEIGSRMHVYNFHSDRTGSYPSLVEVERSLAFCGDVEHEEEVVIDRVACRKGEQENMKSYSS
jgi:hypothetical protein